MGVSEFSYFLSFISFLETFSLLTQLYRFSIAFYSYLFIEGSKPLGEDTYINNLGYISHHTHIPHNTYLYTIIHFSGAILWVFALLLQKFVTWRMAQYKSYWLRTHKLIGHFLLINACIMVYFGFLKSTTQKFLDVKIFFYFITFCFYFSTVMGIYYIIRFSKELHMFWLRMALETPVITSLWTEWAIIFIQSDPLNLMPFLLQSDQLRWRFGELFGLLFSFMVFVPFFSIPNLVSRYNNVKSHVMGLSKFSRAFIKTIFIL